MPFHLTEPHPSHRRAPVAYISHGRGGAGNFSAYASANLTAGPTATGPASLHAQRKSSAASSSATIVARPSFDRRASTFAGRGGAGNVRSADAPRAVYDFDAEISRMEKRRESAGVVHVGRGGAGNAIGATDSSASLSGRRRESGASVSSTGSDRRRSWMGIRGMLGRD